MSSSIGIIGGADGPTAIFVTGNPAGLLIAGGLLVLLFLTLRHFRKKK